MHGLGNDFMVVDALVQPFDLSRTQIQSLANRKTGIGFDQLLLIEAPTEADIDFNYRIFNADGGEVEQCGNGVRCLAKYVRDKKLCGKKSIAVSTQNRVMHVDTVNQSHFRANMGMPQFDPSDVALDLHPDQQANSDNSYTLTHELSETSLHICSMGNPHAVIFVDDVATAAVDSIGPLIESHAQFLEGVNVGFAQIIDRQHIKLRVFERGVGETLACGSGACAAMAVAKRCDLIDQKTSVELGGGTLMIEWHNNDSSPLYMSGPAVTVYDGRTKY